MGLKFDPTNNFFQLKSEIFRNFFGLNWSFWAKKIKNEIFEKKMRFYEIWRFYKSTFFWCTTVNFYRIWTLIPSKFQVFCKLFEFAHNFWILSFFVQIRPNFDKQFFFEVGNFIWSNFGQKWRKLQNFWKIKNFKQNLTFWGYKRENPIYRTKIMIVWIIFSYNTVLWTITLNDVC